LALEPLAWHWSHWRGYREVVEEKVDAVLLLDHQREGLGVGLRHLTKVYEPEYEPASEPVLLLDHQREGLVLRVGAGLRDLSISFEDS